MGAIQPLLILTGKLENWKVEQKSTQHPWGWPGHDHKQSISPYVVLNDNDDDVGEKDKLVFSYDSIEKQGYALSPDGVDPISGMPFHSKIYLSKPYSSLPKAGKASMVVKKLTMQELIEMDFGIKQKGPLYYVDDDGIPCYTLEENVKGKEKIGLADEEADMDALRNNSKHGMVINKSCVNPSGKLKVGLGPKFYNRGSNACINAIVTRYDRYGNVQMMAMQRPKNADSDPGDFQMSAGCIFFGEDLEFNGCKIEGKKSTPYRVTDGAENMDEFGGLRGQGLAYARGAVYTKLWHGEEFKGIIDTWNFDKIAEGIVDDVSNTSEAWVETSYNVHHIMGTESAEELKTLENAKVNKERRNVGFGIWRSIDRDPYDAENVYSQVYDDGSDEPISVKHVGSAVNFDPFKEFDLWHGDHSFVAALVSDFVKEKYRFEGAVDDTSSFGKSSIVRECIPYKKPESIGENSSSSQSNGGSLPQSCCWKWFNPTSLFFSK